MSDGFSASDWAVVVFVFALTTWIGHRMSGKPATLREFFLGGKRLPWYAVAGSIVATEISAVTLISLPAVVFKDGGNLSYLQLGIFGSFLARWLVALFVVPAYYEKEIYSPYDYMGARLGEGVRRTTTVLFSVGGVLGQAARVYLTAVVLEVILHEQLARWSQVLGVSPIVLAISAIGTVSVLWTWMGGIATVIWTDVVLFALFLAAIAIALSTALAHIDGGVTATWEYAQAAGKLQFLNFSTRLSEDYTLWAALIAQGLGGLGTYGTDQLMAQRIFCCKNKREAQKAILASYGAMLVTVSVSAIGLALYAYYQEYPLSGAALSAYLAKNDRIFPIFITTVIDSPWRGLIVAGAFAAAISSLDSILAALSQTSLSAFYRPKPDADPARAERRAVFVSRVLVFGYGILLCAIAVQCEHLVAKYGSILNLALAMPGYTQGAVLGAFVLAFLPLRLRGDGYPWAAGLAVLTICALAWRNELAVQLVRGAAIALFGLWIALRIVRAAGFSQASEWVRSACLAAGLLGVCALQALAAPVSWVWYVLTGALIAALFGWALDRGSAPRREH
jgi:Na+/proline symporter